MSDLRHYLSLSAEELSAPLWTFPPLDVSLVQRARRRVLNADPELYSHALLAEADERVTELAETE
ncbi:hypothetical protein AQJ43_23560 [Streptomyces avermitilis]|uniref:Uncharacterized protein n=1 Tax=Streptomyces avermitilis TaxID=33903 RepID=A0A4D4M1B3_STRAX|nr:hypothetical protein AQJ43_23560 [Streptomyces avermitilis]OOV30746.1 hypothetical protein SM007_16210 [Streptomyces avermitilis]BBJ53714.1 hypothetical protein SAVMC3_63430 [Streptomyces avermitilis]GDY65718.1 hypothetical protein SAV14893_051110 [Streptomyces avermitilis]GDY74063.1 hypothetical protein SAV31267_035480 [Streptomyces avermitilis]